MKLEQAGEEVPEELAEAVKQADENLFVHLRKALGLDELEACNVGAAPDAARGARVLPRDRRARSPSCGA